MISARLCNLCKAWPAAEPPATLLCSTSSKLVARQAEGDFPVKLIRDQGDLSLKNLSGLLSQPAAIHVDNVVLWLAISIVLKSNNILREKQKNKQTNISYIFLNIW